MKELGELIETIQLLHAETRRHLGDVFAAGLVAIIDPKLAALKKRIEEAEKDEPE